MKLNRSLKIIIVILIIFVVLNVVLYFGTHFTKNITIKDKYIRYRRSASNYHVVDVEGNIYQIRNVWFKVDFNRAEDYQTLEKGKTFNVSATLENVPVL